MTVLVTLKFPVKPLVLENFLVVLKEALKDTRVYEGCETVQTFVERELQLSFWWKHGRVLNISNTIWAGE